MIFRRFILRDFFQILLLDIFLNLPSNTLAFLRISNKFDDSNCLCSFCRTYQIMNFYVENVYYFFNRNSQNHIIMLPQTSHTVPMLDVSQKLTSSAVVIARKMKITWKNISHAQRKHLLTIEPSAQTSKLLGSSGSKGASKPILSEPGSIDSKKSSSRRRHGPLHLPRPFKSVQYLVITL